MNMFDLEFDTTGLKPKEALFVHWYVVFLQEHLAARAAGYSDPNQGHELRKIPRVNEAIDEALMIQANTDPSAKTVKAMSNQLYYAALRDSKMSVAAQAIKLLGSHADVDAFAAEKVELATDEARLERLMRGRKRAASRNADVDTDVSISTDVDSLEPEVLDEGDHERGDFL